jgi:DnaJ-class molecular chaperone
LAADPYTTLSLTKDATQDDIQKADRRLAKKLHPDLNPGNKWGMLPK